MKNIISLNENDKTYPNGLGAIKNRPKILYLEGNIDLLKKPSIAIVGSRDCTEYGYKYANLIAKKIAKNNICIVSGLALRNR